MKTLQSISVPQLWISSSGEVFVDNSKRLNSVAIHDYGIRGPIVYFKNGKSVRQISVYRMLYETYVLQRKLERSEHVEPIDGDDSNIAIENLKIVKVRYSDRMKTGEDDSLWMGIDEVYC